MNRNLIYLVIIFAFFIECTSTSYPETFGNIVIGQDSPTVNYPFEYESIGVHGLVENLRLQSPNSIAFHTGSSLSTKLVIKGTGEVEIRSQEQTPRVVITSDIDGQMRFSTVRNGVAGWSLGQDVADGNKFKFATDSWMLTVGTVLTIDRTGKIGIGSTSPTHKLTVNGPIRAKEVIVDTDWADDVFAEDYSLMPLAEVRHHIETNKRLPGVPSAGEVASEGVSVGEMQSLLLRKIEELTLHVIRQQEEIDGLRHKLEKRNKP
jgi:hypothetical protein